MVSEGARAAAVARLHELYIEDALSIESLGQHLDAVLAAADDARLREVFSALPPPVTLTPQHRRLRGPLVLRAPDGRLALAPGWQLASETTICTGPGRAVVDLAAASWDATHINLRLETWGTLEVLIPTGVAVRIGGRSAAIRVESTAALLPGGPLLSVCNVGPGGQIRIRHLANNRRRVPSVHNDIGLTVRVGAVNAARRFAALWLP